MNCACMGFADREHHEGGKSGSRSIEWVTLTTSLPLIIVLTGCSNFSPDSDRMEHRQPTPLTLTDKNFHQQVIESELPVLVDMWAPWCQPCIEMKPTLRHLAGELDGQVNVGELNVADNPFIREKYRVSQYPMLLLFVDGEEVKRIIGSQSKDSLQESLREHISNEEDHQGRVQQ